LSVGGVLLLKPPEFLEVFLLCAQGTGRDHGFARSMCTMKGGDRVDADGIPLSMIKNWQKAQFLDQVCGTRPLITLIPKCENIRGFPAKRMEHWKLVN
jgi:hypothetical protein